jgi:hypothetical protein
MILITSTDVFQATTLPARNVDIHQRQRVMEKLKTNEFRSYVRSRLAYMSEFLFKYNLCIFKALFLRNEASMLNYFNGEHIYKIIIIWTHCTVNKFRKYIIRFTYSVLNTKYLNFMYKMNKIHNLSSEISFVSFNKPSINRHVVLSELILYIARRCRA